MARKQNYNPKFKGKSRPKGKFESKPKDKELTEVSDKFPQKSEAKGMNDVSWYAKNDQILKDSASYSYNSPIGYPLGIDELLGGLGHVPTAYTVPGLMGLYLVPTIGVSTDASSPANIAAQNVYSYVRYMNSGSKNYDQADLMLYLLTMDSLYSIWNFGRRVYGVLNTYSQLNRYMPRVYLEAMGLDFDDFIANIADFRAGMNTRAAKISAFCVPATMSYFVRHAWIYSNIYKDSDTMKAQQYMFSPQAFYQYDETGSQFGGQLKMKPFYNRASLKKVSDFFTYFDDLLNAVQLSEDIGVMSGDILKAYGNNNLYKLEAIHEDYVVLPVYNEEVLNQIHNCSIFCTEDYTADRFGVDNMDITQNPNTGFLIWDPEIHCGRTVTKQTALLNMPWQDVTPANTMVGSRLLANWKRTTPSSTAWQQHKIKFTELGSEFVFQARVFVYNDQNAVLSQIIASAPAADYADISTLETIVIMMQLLSNFDWSPLMFPAKYDNGTTAAFGAVGDMNNYTILSERDVEKLHLTALLSEFNIPQLGSF